MIDKSHFKTNVRNIVVTVELSVFTAIAPYRVFVAACLVADLLVFLATFQTSAVRAVFVGLSVVSVCSWFFGVVYKLKAVVMLQNEVLMPHFKEPILRLLTANKMRWFLPQGAVLPERRLLGVLFERPRVFGGGKV